VNTHTYEKRSHITTTIEKLIAFHQDPKAFTKLAPPPIFTQLHRDTRTSMTTGEVEFTLWFGPIPIRWLARHEAGPTPNSFADLMIKGPMAYWRHEHIFELDPQGSGVYLIDRVTLAHKAGIAGMFTRLMFDGLPLRFLFFYRHLRTKMSLQSQR
jgi:ligand-binding SRPBCC domain-containing protein